MKRQSLEIEEAIVKLFAQARVASEHAYSPYSGARVGACVLDNKGNVYSGCNVENASYGLTQCAAGAVFFAAIAAVVISCIIYIPKL